RFAGEASMNPIEVATLRDAWEQAKRSNNSEVLKQLVAQVATQLGLPIPAGNWLEVAAQYAVKQDGSSLEVLWARFLAKADERLDDLLQQEECRPVAVPAPAIADTSWRDPTDCLL